MNPIPVWGMLSGRPEGCAAKLHIEGRPQFTGHAVDIKLADRMRNMEKTMNRLIAVAVFSLAAVATSALNTTRAASSA